MKYLSLIFIIIFTATSCKTTNPRIEKCVANRLDNYNNPHFTNYQTVDSGKVIYYKNNNEDGHDTLWQKNVINTPAKEYAPFFYKDSLFFTRYNDYNLREKVAYLYKAEWDKNLAATGNNCCGYQYDMNEGWLCINPIEIKQRNKKYENMVGAISINNSNIYYSSFNNNNDEQLDLYVADYPNLYNPKPIEELNSKDSWESQPSLNAAGDFIIFVSNSSINPNKKIIYDSNNLNLWYSFKIENEWDTPKIVTISELGANEESPFISEDGYLYFSSNKSGNYDIYRVKFSIEKNNNINELIINPSDVENLNDVFSHKINTIANEKYPCLVPEYHSMFYCSDDGLKKFEYDIKTIPVISQKESVILVEYQLLVYDHAGSFLNEATLNSINKPTYQVLSNPCNIKMLESNDGYSYIIPPNSKIGVKFNINLENKPCSITQTKEIIINRKGKPIEQINEDFIDLNTYCESDTVLITVKIKEYKNNIVVSDIKSNLDFFVSGYWRPSLSFIQEEVANDRRNGYLYRTSVSNQEFNQLGSKISGLDKEFDLIIQNISPMIDKAVDCNQYLKLQIYGFTDARGLLGKIIYNGEAINIGFNLSGEQQLIQKSHNNGLVDNLKNNGQHGNVILSKLRAYYTFEAIDKYLEQHKNENWKKLKNENKILLDIEGFGIDDFIGNFGDNPKARNARIYVTFGEKDSLVGPFEVDLKNQIFHKDKKSKSLRKVRSLLPYEPLNDSNSNDEDFFKKLYNDNSVGSNFNIAFFDNKPFRLIDELNTIIQNNQILIKDSSIALSKQIEKIGKADSLIKLIKQNIDDLDNSLSKSNVKIIDTSSYFALSYLYTKSLSMATELKYILENEFKIGDLVLTKVIESSNSFYRIRGAFKNDFNLIKTEFELIKSKFNTELYRLIPLKIIELKDKLPNSHSSNFTSK